MFGPGEPKTIDELLARLARIRQIHVMWIPRFKEPWKDPLGCLARIGITYEEAEERILAFLSKADLHKGPEESKNPRIPEHKWVFYVTISLMGWMRDLYIKLSSRIPEEICVESFHEREKPIDYVEEEEDDELR